MDANAVNTLESIRPNSLRAWFLAARPKTLTAAAVPVMIGAAYAWHLTGGIGYGFVPMALCLLFAFVMQIDANFVNDYYDCVRGRDDNTMRLGPKRACQQGWITLSAMRRAIAFTSLLACLTGLPLICYGGWELVGIGALCLLFCFLYTTSLAGKGLGDLLVLVFFGIIPCCFTAYVTLPAPLQRMDTLPWLLALACGLVVDTLLLVNNYRDIDNDKATGKNTLVVMLGRKVTEVLYLLIVPAALIIVVAGVPARLIGIILSLPTLLLHLFTWRMMCRIKRGTALNKVLGMTARNILIFGIMTTLLIIIA